jgi:hypothetical protein
VGSKTNQPSPTSSIDGVVKTTPAGPGHETPRRAPPIRRRAVRNGWTRWRDSPRGLVVLLQIDRTPRSGRRDWLRWGDGRGPAGDEMRGRPLAIGSPGCRQIHLAAVALTCPTRTRAQAYNTGDATGIWLHCPPRTALLLAPVNSVSCAYVQWDLLLLQSCSTGSRTPKTCREFLLAAREDAVTVVQVTSG